jgi:hypothetical protein
MADLRHIFLQIGFLCADDIRRLLWTSKQACSLSVFLAGARFETVRSAAVKQPELYDVQVSTRQNRLERGKYYHSFNAES